VVRATQQFELSSKKKHRPMSTSPRPCEILRAFATNEVYFCSREPEIGQSCDNGPDPDSPLSALAWPNSYFIDTS
jgi:hypothetical protein